MVGGGVGGIMVVCCYFVSSCLMYKVVCVPKGGHDHLDKIFNHLIIVLFML